MLKGTVVLHVITVVEVTEVEGETEEDMILEALYRQMPLAEIARYEVTTVAAEDCTTTIFHDRDFLDALHAERVEFEAEVFDLADDHNWAPSN